MLTALTLTSRIGCSRLACNNFGFIPASGHLACAWVFIVFADAVWPVFKDETACTGRLPEPA